MIPIPLPLKWVVLGGLMVVVAGFSYLKGGEAARRDLASYKAKIELMQAQLAEAQAKVTTKVVTQYVERVRTVKEQSDVLAKEAGLAVSGTCPGSVGVFHDAAALQVPPAPGGSDEGTTDAQALTGTIIQNYGTCHEVREQLKSLQEWVRSNSALTK
jgi:hypothetical protein